MTITALVDSHIHLLPGIDDGSPDMRSTVDFARFVAAAGVTDVLCTPHLRNPDDPSLDAAAVLGDVERNLESEGISLRLHLGWEVAFQLVGEMSAEELRPYTMAGGRYLLLEAPHTVWPAYAEDAVHRVRLAGMVPVLAHPERNPVLRRRPETVEGLLRLGAVLQGTTSSYLGFFGADSRRFLVELAGRGWLSLLASDAHYDRASTWDLPAVLGRMREKIPGLDVELLASVNPRRMIAGEHVRRAAAAREGRVALKYIKRLSG